jgi:hypothetical protein
MAISSTSFGKGNKGKIVGAKNKQTIIKERMGLDSWQKMADYMVTDGLNKYIYELGNLKGKDYIVCYEMLLKYVKPSLQKSQVDLNANIQIDNISFE